jgi:hypothetical protein
MIDLVVDYRMTSNFINSLTKGSEEERKILDYDDFVKEIDKYGIQFVLRKYDLQDFIYDHKPLEYYMVLWEKLHNWKSDPFQVFKKINSYDIVCYKYEEKDKKFNGYCNLLGLYANRLFGIDIDNLDDYSSNKLYKLMRSDDRVVLIDREVAVFAW